MPRKKGSVDSDYAEKRAAILNKLKTRFLAGSSSSIRFSEMADAAGVSIPTLRHYFPTRSEAISALLEHTGAEGRPYIDRLALVESGVGLAESLHYVGNLIRMGIHKGQTNNLHVLGLQEGLDDVLIGPAYLRSILEPTLQALETRLLSHIAVGEMIACDPRFAALNFVAPLLIAALHQDKLGGDCLRPMEFEALIEAQIGTFLRAYGFENFDS